LRSSRRPCSRCYGSSRWDTLRSLRN